jgi:hypothetical protein
VALHNYFHRHHLAGVKFGDALLDEGQMSLVFGNYRPWPKLQRRARSRNQCLEVVDGHVCHGMMCVILCASHHFFCFRGANARGANVAPSPPSIASRTVP